MIEYLKANFLWIAGMITAAKWIYEYSEKRKWDKSRFLFDRVQDFLSRQGTQTVHLILDWSTVDIELDGEKVRVDEEMLVSALQTHDKKSKFTKTELKLRGLFDEYLDGLNEFLLLSDHGLLNGEDMKEFLCYWIGILNGSDSDKSHRFHKQLDCYMDFYGFDELRMFIRPKEKKEGFFKTVGEFLNV